VALSKRFHPQLRSNTSPQEDLRIHIGNKLAGRVYVTLSMLVDPCTPRDGIEWDRARGWLNELAKIVRKHVLENMGHWTTQRSEAENEGVTQTELRDTNSDPCMTEWWPLFLREVSVTFGKDVDEADWSDRPRGLEQIKHVIQRAW
jgi:hypothetical protein